MTAQNAWRGGQGTQFTWLHTQDSCPGGSLYPVTSSWSPPLKRVGWGLFDFLIRKKAMCYLTIERQHSTDTQLSFWRTSSACPLASKPQRRQLKLGEVLTEKQKAAFFLKHQRPARNGYTSARRVLIHYSVFLIHYKLHLNFLAHVHL